MIKKLDVLDNTVNVFNTEDFVSNVAIGTDTINKINEIIDAINKLQGLQTKKAEPVDGFTEQHKWIGKLCWFWDYKKEDAITGILSDLETTEPQPFVKYGLYYYEHCEPVKPDDDIIYKGE